MESVRQGRWWLVLVAAIGFVVVSVAVRIGLWAGCGFLGEWPLARSLVVGTVMLAVVVGASAVLDRRYSEWRAARMALWPDRRKGTPYLLIGCCLGVLLFFVAFATTFFLGGFTAVPLAVPPLVLGKILVLGFLAVLVNAAWEEFTFRGWPFAVATKAFGGHAVALAVGLFFGLAHFASAQTPSPMAIVSLVLAGLFLSYAYLASGSMTLVIGLHTGWNFAQSLLTSRSLWQRSPGEDSLYSGGAWGIEASLGGVAVTLFAALACLTWYVRVRRKEG